MLKIISDSACDLTDEYLASHDVELIPMYITFDGEHYAKDRLEISRDEFCERVVKEGCIPKTSLPSIQDYADVFTKHIQNGDDVICITISTSLSGSYNSAATARDMVLEEHPDAKLAVVNSTSNTITQGLFVSEAVRMRDDGLNFEQVVEKLGAMTDSTRIFFTIANLDYLLKNGRIGKLASLLTNKIKIRPVIVMKDNEIGIGGISRTRAKSIDAAIELARKYFSSPEHDINDYVLSVGWGYDTEEGLAFKDTVEKALGATAQLSISSKIGAVSICHTGPHPLGISCVRRYETV
jgi:DegV family protein with EDD domain